MDGEVGKVAGQHHAVVPACDLFGGGVRLCKIVFRCLAQLGGGVLPDLEAEALLHGRREIIQPPDCDEQKCARADGL